MQKRINSAEKENSTNFLKFNQSTLYLEKYYTEQMLYTLLKIWIRLNTFPMEKS